MVTPINTLKAQATETLRKADRCRFTTDDIVRTKNSVKFWGKVVHVFQLSPGEWYCNVMAVHPEFYGTIVTYPEKVLDFRNKPNTE